MEMFDIRTSAREEFIDVTERLRCLVAEKGWNDGLLVVSSPHTTAAVTINEAADPSVARDILATLATLVPRHGDYRHQEGNSDAHVKTSLLGAAQLLIVENGKLNLGSWQGVFLCEFDGPRTRRLRIKWLPAA